QSSPLLRAPSPPTATYPLSLHDALPIFDSPTLFRTPVGRLVGVLHTYPVNFARMLEAYWSTGHRKEAVKTIAALVLGGYVLSERSEEHTSELQSRENLVCLLLRE